MQFGPKFKAKWTRDMRGNNRPSAGEARFYDRLYTDEKVGAIRALEEQPKFELYVVGLDGAPAYLGFHKADARFFDVAQNRVRVVDYKGIRYNTADSKLKRKAVLLQYGVEIELMGPAGARERRKAELKKFKADAKQAAKNKRTAKTEATGADSRRGANLPGI